MLIKEKSVAIMQPYLFPYLGYFQLISAVDEFVFYDDVSFIKRGWINRNNILINGEAHLISFPCIKASQNKQINEIEINTNHKDYIKNLNSISLAYKKSPYFNEIFPIIEQILTTNFMNISELCISSVEILSKYLGLDTSFKISSQHFSDTRLLERSERLKAITNQLDATTYVNAIGGQDLYDKFSFKESGINLKFSRSLP